VQTHLTLKGFSTTIGKAGSFSAFTQPLQKTRPILLPLIYFMSTCAFLPHLKHFKILYSPLRLGFILILHLSLTNSDQNALVLFLPAFYTFADSAIYFICAYIVRVYGLFFAFWAILHKRPLRRFITLFVCHFVTSSGFLIAAGLSRVRPNTLNSVILTAFIIKSIINSLKSLDIRIIRHK